VYVASSFCLGFSKLRAEGERRGGVEEEKSRRKAKEIGSGEGVKQKLEEYSIKKDYPSLCQPLLVQAFKFLLSCIDSYG
jgi:hypothetical protein